jgi:hypothetical protein
LRTEELGSSPAISYFPTMEFERAMSFKKFALIVVFVISLGVAAWPSVTQKSVARGVTVAITAGELAEDQNIWDFSVAFHSERSPLDDNIMDAFTLVADGHRAKPLWWEATGPTSAKHRAGTLKFIAIKPRPKSIELQLQRKGEAKARIFRWEFGEWYALN